MSFNAGQEISILKLGKQVILTKNKNKRKKCNSFFKKLVIINNFNVLAGIAQKKTCGNLIFIVVPLEKEIRFDRKGKKRKGFKVRNIQLNSNE